MLLAGDRAALGADVPLIGMNGARTGNDVLRMILAGAHAVEISSAVFTNGFGVLADAVKTVESYLANRDQNTMEIVGRAADRVVRSPACRNAQVSGSSSCHRRHYNCRLQAPYCLPFSDQPKLERYPGGAGRWSGTAGYANKACTMASSAGRCATATWPIYRFSIGNSWSKNAPFRILDYIRCN